MPLVEMSVILLPIETSDPNKRRFTNVGIILAQRLRRWANIIATLVYQIRLSAAVINEVDQ